MTHLLAIALLFALALPASTACAAATSDSAPADDVRGPTRALIVSGANNHDWEWTTPRLKEILEASGKFVCDITYEPGETLADADGLANYAVLVLDYNGPRWGDAAERNFLAAVKGGTGVSIIHAANNAFPGWVEYEKLVGHLWRKGTGHGKVHPFDVRILDRDHPITRDMCDLKQHPDELYHRLVHMHDSDKRVLAAAHSAEATGGTGQDELMITVSDYGQGHIFHTPLGHVWRNGSRAAFEDPQFHDLVVRGTEWAATGEVSVGLGQPNQLTAAEEKDGWRLLFDGESLAGWRGYQQNKPPAGWSITDGALTVKAGGAGGDLITEEQFGDMEFAFEFQVTPKANSGVMVRVTENSKASYHSGPEYQVLDDIGHNLEPDNPHSVGSLYGLAAPSQKVARIPGAWNEGRIRIRGFEMTHWLNGHQVASLDLAGEEGRRRIEASKFKQWEMFARAARGHIALQDHGNEVRYRSLRVLEL